MPNLSATATLRICVTPDSKHVKDTHLDQTVLVSARGTNRNTIQPLDQLEESCQDTTKRSHRRQSLHMECTLGQTRHAKSFWLRKGEPNGAFQLPAGYLKWLGVEPQWHFSDTLSILAQRHMSGPGVMGCWTSQTMQNAAVCFEEGHQNRCCNLRAGGSCFKCVNPMWRSDCWREDAVGRCHGMSSESMLYGWTGQASGPDHHVTMAILNWHQSFTTPYCNAWHWPTPRCKGQHTTMAPQAWKVWNKASDQRYMILNFEIPQAHNKCNHMV